MDACTRADGKMDSSTERVCSFPQVEKKEMVPGKMVLELSGMIKLSFNSLFKI